MDTSKDMRQGLFVLLLMGCHTEQPVTPYHVFRLEPFSAENADKSCPQGYDTLATEQCRDNPRFVAATILCKGGP